jgi:pimeloyl-ACP methyl ester carboxylesterase
MPADQKLAALNEMADRPSAAADFYNKICRKRTHAVQQKIMFPDCGHWTQQEKPDSFNSALLHFLTFLNGLDLQLPLGEICNVIFD